MIYVTAYLAIGALLAALMYRAVGRAIDHRAEDDSLDAEMTALEKNTRTIPGGMGTLLVIAALLWPGFVAFYIADWARRG
jgi:hypothetical protein